MVPDQSQPNFEEVFTVTDYYDGPRRGIANYNGLPHFYDSVFSDEKQDYTCLYRLTPISAEVFQLALEDWVIWRRWEHAFASGVTGRETHPALPEDTDRHAQLESLLNGSLETNPTTNIVRAGRFTVKTLEARAGVLADLLVRWMEPSKTSDGQIWSDDKSG